MKNYTIEWSKTDLNENLECWIEQRTMGRVHGLSVETAGERVIVHGHTGSYHVRQLALTAVLEAMEATDFARSPDVELDIQVGRLGGANLQTTE